MESELVITDIHMGGNSVNQFNEPDGKPFGEYDWCREYPHGWLKKCIPNGHANVDAYNGRGWCPGATIHTSNPLYSREFCQYRCDFWYDRKK